MPPAQAPCEAGSGKRGRPEEGNVASRSMTKGAKSRERILEAVIEAVAARGLADLSVADIGAAAGMSAGHVMYYFNTKDTLFVEALQYSEGLLDNDRARLLNRTDTPAKLLHDYIALYLPASTRDARWSLWLEVWNRSLTHPELNSIQLELDARWQHDLESIVRNGLARSSFAVTDVGATIETITSLLDGFATRMLTGTPGLDRHHAIRLATSASQTLLGYAEDPDHATSSR
jgi:AcrR family transcriptional regulator